MEFNPMIKKPYKGKRDKNYNYQLVLYRKRDIEKWLEEIGFRNPKHSTKVQIWKKFGYCPPNTKIKFREKYLVSYLAKLKIGTLSVESS